MSHRINGIAVNSGRSSGCIDYIMRFKKGKARVFIVCPVQIETKHTERFVIIGYNLDYLLLVKNCDIAAQGLLLQTFGHHFRGKRTHRRGSGPCIVVGFIADVFAEVIHREIHPELAKRQKAAHRIGRFCKSIVAVNAFAGKKLRCH